MCPRFAVSRDQSVPGSMCARTEVSRSGPIEVTSMVGFSAPASIRLTGDSTVVTVTSQTLSFHASHGFHELGPFEASVHCEL